MSSLHEIAFPKKQHQRPLKRSMSGFETELFVLDHQGRIDNTQRVYNAAKQQDLNVQAECAKSMVEVICLPHRGVKHSMLDLWQNISNLLDIARKNGCRLFPFSTYPGQQQPQFRNDPWYSAQERIFGKERFQNAGLCCGFHQHYTLPRGLFDHKTKTLKPMARSKVKRSLLDSYNLLNATDPILTSLLQSSPYAQGRLLAKDSRILLYRGGDKLNYPKGLYANHQLFGGLSPYKQTMEDLLSTLRRKNEKWKELVHHAGGTYNVDSILHSAWNPVKINAHGTLEYRGTDMNLPGPVVAVSTIIKFLLRKIQQDFLLVMPLDIDVKEAFTQEGNLLFIPPQSTIRKQLQHASAYRGLADNHLHAYAKRFLRFVKPLVYKDYRPLLRPVQDMLNDRKTMSDKIIMKAKKLGAGPSITPNQAQELSLYYSTILEQEVLRTVDKLKGLVF